MGASGNLSTAPDEVTQETEDIEHLVCGCRPPITMCGVYLPDVTSVVYGDECGPNDCEDCFKVWRSRGCGACSCNSTGSCTPCWDRYHAACTDRP